jgi:hypothetical protein
MASRARRVAPDTRKKAELIDTTGYAEYHWLAVKFSSGVTLKELVSIAEIASTLADVNGPSRGDKRNFRLIVCWFKRNWTQLIPCLNLIQLRDEKMNIIDGTREIMETGKRNFPLVA